MIFPHQIQSQIYPVYEVYDPDRVGVFEVVRKDFLRPKADMAKWHFSFRETIQKLKEFKKYKLN